MALQSPSMAGARLVDATASTRPISQVCFWFEHAISEVVVAEVVQTCPKGFRSSAMAGDGHHDISPHS